MPEKSWTLLGSRDIASWHVIRLREDRYRFEPSGREGEFVVCDTPDWVLVIAITPEEQVVFVRQYRHGVREVVLEIPGGIIDAGETPEAAAVRELLEETGYTAERVRVLGRLMPNPAMNSAHFHAVLAEGCRPTVAQSLDPFERIDVVLHPLSEVPAMLRRGELVHAQVIAAFALLQAVGR